MTILFPATDDPVQLLDQARRLAADIERLVSGAPFDGALLAGAPVLDAWRPATRLTQALTGVVVSHPHIVDGHQALTSELFAADLDAGWARTWSRFYRLGRAHGDGRLQ